MLPGSQFVYIFPAPMATFYDRFVACAERWPTNLAVEVQGPSDVESYTYAELRQMAGALAGWLLDQKIQPGSRVAILADNHLRWVVAYLGIIAAGGTVVPLDTNYDAHQVAKLLADSHVVSVHLLLNDETRGFLSRERIAAMRKGVILVNTARGAIVDEAAMIDALKSGHIRHAGLDVFNIEPLPKDHPLTKVSNVTLSAHSAFRTPEASENLIHAAWEHCRRIVKG